jgi:hypothetical protein
MRGMENATHRLASTTINPKIKIGASANPA